LFNKERGIRDFIEAFFKYLSSNLPEISEFRTKKLDANDEIPILLNFASRKNGIGKIFVIYW